MKQFIKKHAKAIKMTLTVLCVLTACLSSGVQFTKAAAPPELFTGDDGGGVSPTGARYRFCYELHRKSYDPIKGTAVYELSEYYTISGGSIPVVSDIVHLTNKKVTNKYIGEFKSGNAASKGPGTYYRSEKFTLNLVEGTNKIKIRGEYEGNDSGDADFTVKIEKFGHEPVVHGKNGTWISGEVSSGKRTNESLYTDGAAGSAAGNKTQTSTGFSYTDEDEQKTATYKYSGKTLGNNATIKSIKKNGTTVNFSALDKPGTYVVTSCTTDSADNEACGTRNIVVKSKYQVKYNGNGATSGSMSNSSHVYDTAKALTANAYTKTGYQFNHWNTKADDSGTDYTNQQSVKNLTSTDDAIVNLYAQWTANTYSVKYNGNGATSGTMANTTHTYNTAKALRKNTYVRSGWKFIGWNTKADGTGTGYTDEKSVKNLTSVNNDTVNLYAQWDKAPSLTITHKVFYENEISMNEWTTSYRMRNITATDQEDGSLTDEIKIVSDNVELDKAGSYEVVYEVTDSVGQTVRESSEITIVYNNPPTIEAENQLYTLGDITQSEWENELRYEIAAANDVEDGDISDMLQITLDETDTAVPGFYHVVYEITDRFNKKCEKQITVEIRYNQLPKLEANNITIYENELTSAELTERLKENVSAHDAEDGDLSEQVRIVSNNVDTTIPGNYEVTYEVVDSKGAIGTKTIDVTVLENHAPILQLFVSNKRFIEGQCSQSEWETQLRMKGVSAHDREDRDLTDQIQIVSDSVNPQKRGTYEVTYRVSDRFGKSTEKTAQITVEPNEAPIIYANDKYFTTNDTITDSLLLKNVYASDDHDEDINEHIVVKSSNIENGKAGSYEVIYEAVDSLGKSATHTITVHISEAHTPPITPPVPEDMEVLYWWNGKQQGIINVTKLMEQSQLGHDKDALKDVVFGVYAKEDIVYQNQVILRAGSLVAITKADENGQLQAIIHHKGKYILKELSTNGNYILDGKEYEFTYK